MLIFCEAGLDLTGLIIIIFLILGIVSILFSAFSVFLYYTISKKTYTRKEFWMNTLLVSVILMVGSGMVCGMMIR